MTQKAIVKTAALVRGAITVGFLTLLAACQTSAPRDTTFSWNLATDPPDQSRPAYAPADRAPVYTPSEQGSAYAPAGHVDVRPLDQPSGTPQKKTAPAWYQQSSVRDEGATTQTASVNPASVQFAWPLRGRIISEFGTKLSGERNDGINIAAALGAPIRAAANGTVTYAGDGLKGYGNLVLIRHAEGYVTAYAHADTLAVAKGDIVSKGQVIGYAGNTGGAAEPQLHFEIRHGTTPVNPRSLLAEPQA
jgi:murein DD-endopeptidase MepM/ murein hydrolase activator NlpD